MEPLKIESTPKTPQILFDNTSGIFSMKGMSCAEYAREFYTPVNEWLDEYSKAPSPVTCLDVHFKYFNTSSAKCLLSLFQKLNEIRLQGNQVVVNWYYEKDDEQMVQDGENYSELLDFPFCLKELA